MRGKFDDPLITNNKYSCIDSSKYRELVNYSKKEYGNLKSPLAGGLLGLIPGMGYIYSEEMGTGITAFFVVAISATASYFAFTTNNKAIGIFVGAIGTFFYTGNVVGGYLAARRYNRRKMQK